MDKRVWGIFIADSKKGFPNFFPIGIYSNYELAERELGKLPQAMHYQLFELPIDQFFGFVKGEDVQNGMGKLPHEHFVQDK